MSKGYWTFLIICVLCLTGIHIYEYSAQDMFYDKVMSISDVSYHTICEKLEKKGKTATDKNIWEEYVNNRAYYDKLTRDSYKDD